ncbi:hypothetical protein MCAMS1_02507 [biofilm metagenome]
MIYSDTFVWLHFPKCAGTKVEKLFQDYYSGDSRIIQDSIGRINDPTISWHDSIAARELRNPQFKLGNREVICSFRRLISWLESRYVYEQIRAKNLEHKPGLLLEGKFLEQDGQVSHADNYVTSYLPESLLESGKLKFIRCEHFAEDFKTVFAEHLDVSIIPEEKFDEKVNTAKAALHPDIHKLLLENKNLIYSRCPYWRKVELKAYEGSQ